jgi:outer membrane receptor protein involved in Fe transport
MIEGDVMKTYHLFAASALASMPVAAAAADMRQYAINLPSQSLGQSLTQISKTAGIQLVFTDRAITQIRAPKLSGRYTVDKMLSSVLANTGYVYRFTSPRSIRIVPGTGAAAVLPAAAQIGSDEPKDRPLVLAQADVDAARQDAAVANAASEITVTGSRIHRPNLDSSNPITSVGRDELLNSGDLSVGDSLNELPSLSSTFGSGPSAKGIGTAGLNFLDLRGLGLDRTLVLVNGRRHVAGFVGRNRVDVSTIPSELIDRIDVVTGGSSAVYGSDAIAGVVNFILRRDFEGVRLHARAGTAARGGRENYMLSATAGRNFAQDRGNVAVSLEYAKQNPLTYAQREDITGAFGGRTAFQQTDQTTGEPAAGDGIPDNTLQFGLLTNNISYGGMVQGATDFFAFDREGNLQRSVCSVSFAQFAGSPNCIGGLGITTREYLELLPTSERMIGNLLASFEAADSARFFFEGKYVRTNSRLLTSPFSITSTVGINNAFLTPQARETILRDRPGATNFTLRRLFGDLGPRQDFVERNVFRLVGGVDGKFNDDWRYEVSVNYGRITTDEMLVNFPITANLSNALNAVRNAQGRIVCAVNADSSAANDDPACIPLDLLGEGRASPEALAYVSRPLARADTGTEFVVSAFLSGDTSELFSLPGGPVGFAFGGEYRRATAAIDQDPLVEAGVTAAGRVPDLVAPAFEVKELFGELNLPILRDRSLAHELSLSAAGRVSEYKGKVGTVYAYNIGGIYAPVRDLRFRAHYSRSVRAPTIVDLYDPQFIFNVAFSDPCDVANIGLNPNRAKNCADAGIPAGFINLPARNERLNYSAGGNPDLIEETSDSYTAGIVFTPSRILPGFSISADYYNIKVSNVISNLGPGGVIASCYDSPTGLDNPFCPLVKRLSNGLFDPASAVLSSPINFAALETAGIDVDASYRRNLGTARLNLRAIASYIIKRDAFLDPANPDFRDRQKSEVGSPALEGLISANIDFGNYNLGYKVRYLGRQTAASYETQHGIDGRPPTNADAFEDAFLPARIYHDVHLGFDVNERFTFYGGIDNLFDKDPPIGRVSDNIGEPWDPVGRFLYVGARVNF